MAKRVGKKITPNKGVKSGVNHLQNVAKIKNDDRKK